MTRIERVDVEGFKGIESLDVESSAINVVTGRNNTGKTSLLEAIEIAFDPTAIGKFGGNIDTLVNADSDRIVTSISTAEDGPHVEIHQPGRGRTEEILIRAIIESTSNLRSALQRRVDNDADGETSFDEEFRTIVDKNITPEIVEDATDEIVVVSMNGTEYPFLLPLAGVGQLRRKIADEFRERFSEYKKSDNDNSRELSELHNDFEMLLDQFEFTGIGASHFVGDEPPTSDAVTFVDIPDLTDQPEPENGEADAVKIDDVEDFLVEKEIVDDLRDFDLDYLVFEDDDGEKYSVPYEFMGDGFRAIVGLLWELLDDDVSGDVVLLEEPGTHMHPGYVRELVYFLVDIAREEDVQLFLTTHNNDFISDFFNENLTDEERSFLQEEFTLLQMQEDAVDVMSYEEAEEHLKDLHLDLRGL